MRYFSSTAGPMYLQSSINSMVGTITVDTTVGLPASTPFVLAVEYETANEELVEVTNVDSTTLTVTRGVDGTTAQSHSSGVLIRHVASGKDLQDLYESAEESAGHIAADTDVHGVSGDVVGTTDTQTLTNKTIDAGDNTITGIDTSSLEDGAVTTDKIEDDAVTTDKIVDEAVTNDKVVDAVSATNTSFCIPNTPEWTFSSVGFTPTAIKRLNTVTIHFAARYSGSNITGDALTGGFTDRLIGVLLEAYRPAIDQTWTGIARQGTGLPGPYAAGGYIEASTGNIYLTHTAPGSPVPQPGTGNYSIRFGITYLTA